uniref:Uncharacterized protein n=1 Tax=Heterorhabditis bacteriophora TaxID=37862 RepID=A0A1I7WW14_HETBA
MIYILEKSLANVTTRRQRLPPPDRPKEQAACSNNL